MPRFSGSIFLPSTPHHGWRHAIIVIILALLLSDAGPFRVPSDFVKVQSKTNKEQSAVHVVANMQKRIGAELFQRPRRVRGVGVGSFDR